MEMIWNNMGHIRAIDGIDMERSKHAMELIWGTILTISGLWYWYGLETASYG